MKDDLIHIALENLQRTTQIKGTWRKHDTMEIDGVLELPFKNQVLNYNVEIKQEIRNHQLPDIIKMSNDFSPFMVVAQHIFPKIKEELKKNNIAYLETNGNVWLQQNDVLLWIEGQKPNQEIKKKSNRAFTKTGLKVVFHFLIHEEDINLTYRELEDITDFSLGNISNVIKGLKELGFLIKLNKNEFKLTNKQELIEKWITAYHETLKPSLQIGTFRFLKTEDFVDWEKIELKKGKTFWGAEPAADLLTNYLHPAELTLYTVETRNELIQNYRLIPVDNGNIKVYQKFWHHHETGNNTVPPLLIYADLMNSNDRRCTETAQKIYDEYLRNNL